VPSPEGLDGHLRDQSQLEPRERKEWQAMRLVLTKDSQQIGYIENGTLGHGECEIATKVNKTLKS
jgi:hypothetical protein